MRRIVFICLCSILLFCFAAPQTRGFTLVQKASASTGATSNSVTFPSANATGNLIIVSVGWLNGGTPSVSDSRGNTYVSAIGPTASGDPASQIWYAANIAGGTNTVTVCFDPQCNQQWDNSTISVFEYSGLATTSVLDVAASNTGSSNTLDTGSVTTTQPNELIFATGYGNSGGTLTADSDYIMEQYSTWAGAHLGVEDRSVSATGSYHATFTDTGSWTWVAQIATFKAAASGAPTCGLLDDGSSVYAPQNYTTFVPNAKMVPYPDTSFNCSVVRLTDGQTDFGKNTSHNYVRSAFNADSSKFLAYQNGPGIFYAVDVASGNVLVAPGQFEFGGASADETWDRNNPNTIYYELYNSNVLKKADISACTATAPCDGTHGTSVATSVVHTFTEYTALDSGNNKKDISLDGCYLAMGGVTSSGNMDAFWYNICTNTKSSAVQTCSTSLANHFTSGMTHSNKMWVAWGGNGTGSCQGTWLYDTNMSVIGQLYTSAVHSTAVYDPVAGKEYIVFEASGDSSTEICNSGTTDGIGKIETDVAPPFPKSCIVGFPYALGDVHVSSNNATGWFAAEIADVGDSSNYTNCTVNCTANDNSGLPSNWSSLWGHLYNEVIAMNISTGQIYRLAHDRSRLTNNGTTGTTCGGYWSAPRVSMDFSGTRIAFDSSMARIGSPLPSCIQDYVDVYMIKFR